MENELEKLADVTSPPPSEASRARAMALAMQAFDEQKKFSGAP